MQAVAKNPAFAKKAGVPSSVGRDFVEADKGRKFAEGGNMKDAKMEMRHAAAMKKAGLPKKMVAEEMKEAKEMKKYAKGGGVESRGKTKGKIVKMACGGMKKGR